MHKRLGRGNGSGTGKTSGRGQKGHGSRSGGGNFFQSFSDFLGVHPRFEGG